MPSSLLTLFTPSWHFPEDPPGWHPSKVASALPHLVGGLNQHQHSSVSAPSRLGTAASHTESHPCTCVPATVGAWPHSQPDQGPASPASVSKATVARTQQEATQFTRGTPLGHPALVTKVDSTTGPHRVPSTYYIKTNRPNEESKNILKK